MRARTFPSATTSNWLKHTLCWVDERHQAAARRPAGAPAPADQRGRADPAAKAGLLMRPACATGSVGTEEPRWLEIRAAEELAGRSRARRITAPSRARKRLRRVQGLPLRPGERAATRASTRFEVDLADCGPMVLDALIKIKTEQDSGAHLPPLLPRGRVRLVLDEHRRPQHARLHQGDRGHRRATSRSTRCRTWR